MRRLLPFLLCLLCFSGCGERETLRICFTGDVIFDRGIRQIVNMVGYHAVLEEFTVEFGSADYTVVNMESPVTDIKNPRDKLYVFRSDPECLSALKEAGVTHLNLANNHSMDQGFEGFASTVRNIQKSGLVLVGTSLENPVLINKGSVTAALFSANWIETDFIASLDSDSLPCITPADSLLQLITKHKKAHPKHHIVVILHWGYEYIESPDAEQIDFAHRLVDAGAEAIIGHHPHVLQPMEMYKNKPIYYSLGNLIFDQSWVGESGKCAIIEFY